MTPMQRQLARHALGLPNKDQRSYRNRYIAVPGTREYESWREMVEAKEAVMHTGEEMGLGNADYFRLRHMAALSALDTGESLDREDFPSGADFVEMN